MKGTIVNITSHVFPGCGWVTCPEGWENRTGGLQENSSQPPLLPLKPTPWIAWMTTHQMPILYLKERARLYKNSLFVCSELTLILWLTMMDKKMVPRSDLKQNHVPMSSKGS